MFETVNPFDFTGPQFLQFYAICLGVVSAITIAWRVFQWVAPRESAAARGKPLDIWELAYLRGRDLAVAQTAVVDLSSAKLIEADKEKTKLVAASLEPKKQLSAVPMAIFRAAQSAGGVSAARLPKEIAFECERIRKHLIDRGFVKTWGDRFWEVWPGHIGFGFLLVIGLFRVGLGIYRDKPVGYLILLLALTLFVKFALTYTRFITTAGKQAFRDSIAELEKHQGKSRKATAVEPIGAQPGAQVPALASWTFAVMGLATAQSMLDPSIMELIKKRGIVDGSGSSGCTGAGGGDGGGGCAGGGGCGGGGCGGCGS